MKVCLITPPSPFLLDERVFVSLGILKVASALEARGHIVEMLDLSGVANFEEAAAAHAKISDATTFALTATTPQMPAAAKIIQAIKAAEPSVHTIIGGPHPTLVNAAVKQGSSRAVKALEQLQSLFDVVVAGDGEDSIEPALRAAPGTVIDADDPKGPLFLTSKRLEQTPRPARHLVDMESYHYTIDGVDATTLVAQLGCPFACTFCGGRASPMLRRIRTRSTQSILDEVEFLHTNYGYRGFMFYDDELNVNKSIVELMRGITTLAKKHNTEFRLRGFVKAELFTAEQAEVMYEAGFRWLLTGFESGSPRILDNINKKADVEDNDRCVAFAKGAGLKVKALMSIGHAGESPDTVEETKQWLLRTRPEDFDCTIITPYPGSPYYDDAALMTSDEMHVPLSNRTPLDNLWVNMKLYQRGPIPIWTYTAPRTKDRLHAFELDYTKEADYYKGAPGGGYVSHVFTDHLSPEDLVRLRDDLEKSVREKLVIPFNQSAAAIRFEHSMGQAGPLPPNLLRSTAP